VKVKSLILYIGSFKIENIFPFGEMSVGQRGLWAEANELLSIVVASIKTMRNLKSKI
jgi:hypothetical protein